MGNIKLRRCGFCTEHIIAHNMSSTLFPLRYRYSQAAAVHGELDCDDREKELLLAVAVRF